MSAGRVRATPPLTALNAFERAAAHLSFRHAAEELAISPSAVSHQIRALEEYFGLRLFIRGARPLALTSDGVSYLADVVAGLAKLDEASRALLRRGRDGSPALTISAIPFFTQTLIMPALGEFHARYPTVELTIETTQSYSDVGAGVVDVAIRKGREHAAGLRLEPLLETWHSPVMSPALAGFAVRRPEDILRQKLIEIRRRPYAWSEWLAAAGVPGEPRADVIRVDTVGDAMEAAELGFGVALGVFPVVRARPGFGERLVAPFDTTSGPSTIYFVTRPENARDRYVEAFRQWVFEVVPRRLAPASSDPVEPLRIVRSA